MSLNRSRRAFTLIELLVVIAIISILAAILFPVFARARENARRASCQSNLKQIALGVFMYNQDYDEKLPKILVNNNRSPNNPYGWADALQPYLKSTQIFQCPSEPHSPGDAPGTYYHASVFNGMPDPRTDGYTDYWMNRMAAGVSLARFSFPSQTVLLGDGGNYYDDHNPGNMNWYNTSSRYSSTGTIYRWTSLSWCSTRDPSHLAQLPDGGNTRHLEGANFAFADGHVKWIKGVKGTHLVSAIKDCATEHKDADGMATFNLN